MKSRQCKWVKGITPKYIFPNGMYMMDKVGGLAWYYYWKVELKYEKE